MITWRKQMKRMLSIVVLAFSALLATGNAPAQAAKDSAITGAAIGALTGGIVSGKFGGAAVGAVAGGSLGYVVGNEKDKKRAQEQAAREQAAREKAKVSSDPATAYEAPEENPFVGSTWQVVSLVTEEPAPEYASIVVTFPTNSKVTTMAVRRDGEAETWVESYRIVDDVMVLSGKDRKTGEPYMINAKFSIEDNQLILVAPEGRAVLEEIEEDI